MNNSFSYALKREIAQILPESQDEAISELSAIIKTSGEIYKKGKNFNVKIKTELEEVCTLIDGLVKLTYGKSVQIVLSADKVFSKPKYEVSLPQEISMQILQDTEIVTFDEQKYLQISSEISAYLVAEPQLAKSYLRGALVGCFSCSIALTGENFSKRSTGYHAEVVFQNQTYAQNFGLFLADFDIISKTVERKGFFVVYVKDFEMICDLLVLCGATKSVLSLQNENAMRSIRNNVNRQTNCISANLTKTVDASIREMEAIDTIRDTIGFDALDEDLRAVCYLRMANPEESLDNLAKLCIPPISKSALYRRFKKIEKIANELKK